jgi:hypothetical protein
MLMMSLWSLKTRTIWRIYWNNLEAISCSAPLRSKESRTLSMAGRILGRNSLMKKRKAKRKSMWVKMKKANMGIKP